MECRTARTDKVEDPSGDAHEGDAMSGGSSAERTAKKNMIVNIQHF